MYKQDIVWDRQQLDKHFLYGVLPAEPQLVSGERERLPD